MNPDFVRKQFHSRAPALCISIALVLVLLLGGWGAYQEREYARESVLRSEITRIRSHAERTADWIERRLCQSIDRQELPIVAQSSVLREHWENFVPPPDSVHGAVVDSDGKILSHSDPEREGGVLCESWNVKPVLDAGGDVYSTNCRALTGGLWTLDIPIPIRVDGVTIGAYHAGASQSWIDQQITQALRHSDLGWTIVIGGITTVVLLSSVALYQMTRRSVLLEDALKQSDARRLKELSSLIVGLAHEVRNPLNSVRLNLFMADRVFRGDAGLDHDEMITMLSESVREIERVDSLMTLLLGFARVDDTESVVVDVADEVDRLVQFLEPTLSARGVSLNVKLSDGAAFLIRAGRGQVRQVLLNLLTNARDAVPAKGGKIRIELAHRDDCVEVTVTDNGEGIRPEFRERLFSPFFSTKDEGTGLGLALVRSLVERTGGDVECVVADAGCCQFRVKWPAWHDDHHRKRTA